MPTLSFALASAALLLIPGPTNTLLAAAGASRGPRSAAALPVAEALGYAMAIPAYALVASNVGDTSLGALRIASAAWLAWSAVKLWRSGREGFRSTGVGFLQVLVTTLLNPKAMIVGTVMIPGEELPAATPWIATYVALALLAGALWTALGAAIPVRLAPASRRVAAVALAGFSTLAAVAALG